MTAAAPRGSTRNSRLIKSPPEKVYRAFMDPAALAVWLAPGDMTGKVHSFDGRVGGGYQMSLFYPASEQDFKGKTTEKEDRFAARFVELVPLPSEGQAQAPRVEVRTSEIGTYVNFHRRGRL